MIGVSMDATKVRLNGFGPLFRGRVRQLAAKHVEHAVEQGRTILVDQTDSIFLDDHVRSKGLCGNRQASVEHYVRKHNARQSVMLTNSLPLRHSKNTQYLCWF
jgi:hypothetical protein